MELQNPCASQHNVFIGTVVSLKDRFGFIKVHGQLPDGFTQKQVFFRFSSIRGDKESLNEQDVVEFSLKQSSTARPAALNVWLKRDPLEIRSTNQNMDEAHPSVQNTPKAETRQKTDLPERKRVHRDEERSSHSSGSRGKRSKTDFKLSQYYQGRIVKIMDEGFGFLHPTEALPDEYRQNKDVYFRVDRVNTGGFLIEEGDTLEFRLGSLEKDRERPFALSPKVVTYKQRHIQMIEGYIASMKETWLKNSNKQDDKKSFLDIMSCSAVWKAIGCCWALSDRGVANLLTLILDLKSCSSGLKSHYVSMLQTLSQTKMFNPWSGRLKDYIESTFQSSDLEDIEQLQNFLVAFLEHVPGKARAVIAMLRPIAETVRRGSKLEFFYSLLKVMSRLCSSEIEDMEWNEVPLVPDIKELMGGLEPHFNLSQVKTSGPYSSPQEYMDTYFRLLRSDCFDKLRMGIRDLLKGKLDPRDMHVYHSIRMAGIKVTTNGTGLVIALKVTPQREIRNWATCSNLMFGNLLCLSPSGKFIDPIWATVTHRDTELLKKNQVILVELCPKCNTMSDAEVIRVLTQSAGAIVMAESPTYYKAYQPVLDALQSMDPEFLPFSEQLVDVQPPDRPSFINPPSTITMVDGSMVYCGTDEMTYDEFIRMPTLKRMHRDITTTLDVSQEKAILQALDNKIAVIQGPPGTGKTFIGVKLVQLLMSMSTLPSGPILVLTYKNHALDEFLKTVVQIYPDDVARIGGRSKEPELEKINLNELRKATRRSDALFKMTQELMGQMEGMKSEIEAIVKKTADAQYFTKNTFLQQLTSDQVKQLILGCDWSKKEINLRSLHPLDIILPIAKHHLDELFRLQKGYIPTSEIQEILNRCQNVTLEFLKRMKDKMDRRDIDHLISRVETKLIECLTADDEILDFDTNLTLACLEMSDALNKSTKVSTDILSHLMLKIPQPLNEFILSNQGGDLWGDVSMLFGEAVNYWLPEKRVYEEVRRQFFKQLHFQEVVLERKQGNPSAYDEITDEHDIEEEQLERLAAITSQHHKPGKVEGLLLFQSKPKILEFKYEIELLSNTKVVLETISMVSHLGTEDLWSIGKKKKVPTATLR